MRIDGARHETDWSGVVREHGPVVWRVIYRLVGSAEEARDCYQEVFLAAVQQSRRGPPVQNWEAYLRATATRRAIDHLRRKRVRKRRWGIGLSGEGPPDPGAPTESRVTEADLCERVRRLLADLPARQAEAFWLRHIEQRSVDEIAAQMEVAPGNVYVLINRATGHLREALGIPRREMREVQL